MIRFLLKKSNLKKIVMKKKLLQLLGLMAFIAILSLNLNFSGTENDFDSQSLITTAKADMEPGDWQLCNT